MAKTRLFPNAVTADTASFALTGAATKPEAIDDPYGVPDDEASYLGINAAVSDRIRFGFQNLTAGIGTINFAELVVRVRRVSGGNGDASIYVRSSGVDYDSASFGMASEPTALYVEKRYLLGKNPAGAVLWTPAAVDALEGGLIQASGDITTKWTQLYLEVDHPAVPLGRGAAQHMGATRVHLRRTPLEYYKGRF